MLDVCLYEEMITMADLFVTKSEEAVRSINAFEQLNNSALTYFRLLQRSVYFRTC